MTGVQTCALPIFSLRGFATVGLPIGPSSTCYPEFVWACAGDTSDPPYDPNTSIAPSYACFTEVDPSGNPVVRKGNFPADSGRWIESKFDLYRYRGRQIWVRFLI